MGVEVRANRDGYDGYGEQHAIVGEESLGELRGVIIRLLLECIQEFTADSLYDEEGDGHGCETEGDLSSCRDEDPSIGEGSYQEQQGYGCAEEMQYESLFLVCHCFRS